MTSFQEMRFAKIEIMRTGDGGLWLEYSLTGLNLYEVLDLILRITKPNQNRKEISGLFSLLFSYYQLLNIKFPVRKTRNNTIIFSAEFKFMFHTKVGIIGE